MILMQCHQSDQVPGVFLAGPEILHTARKPGMYFHGPEVAKSLSVFFNFSALFGNLGLKLALKSQSLVRNFFLCV